MIGFQILLPRGLHLTRPNGMINPNVLARPNVFQESIFRSHFEQHSLVLVVVVVPLDLKDTPLQLVHLLHLIQAIRMISLQVVIQVGRMFFLIQVGRILQTLVHVNSTSYPEDICHSSRNWERYWVQVPGTTMIMEQAQMVSTTPVLWVRDIPSSPDHGSYRSR